MLTNDTIGLITTERLLELLNDRQWLRGAYIHAWTHTFGQYKPPCSVSEMRSHLMKYASHVMLRITTDFKGVRDLVTFDTDANVGIASWGDKWRTVEHNAVPGEWHMESIARHKGQSLYYGLMMPLCPSILSTALAMVADGTLKVCADGQKFAKSLAQSLNDKYDGPKPAPPPAPAPIAPPQGVFTPLEAILHSDGFQEPVKSFDNSTIGESEMSNHVAMQATFPRRLVIVRITDNDRSLLVEHSSVADLGPFMTEDSDQTAIMQALTDYDVNGAIAKHNEIRAGLTDEAILKATGQDVKLRPIKLKDLTLTVIAK